jgi:hypothetical protein
MTRRRSVSLPRLPTPEELDAAPELAILAALEATLALTIVALQAAHPETWCEPHPFRAPPPDARAAQGLIAAARRLGTDLLEYLDMLRRSRPPLPPSSDDIPF